MKANIKPKQQQLSNKYGNHVVVPNMLLASEDIKQKQNEPVTD